MSYRTTSGQRPTTAESRSDSGRKDGTWKTTATFGHRTGTFRSRKTSQIGDSVAERSSPTDTRQMSSETCLSIFLGSPNGVNWVPRRSSSLPTRSRPKSLKSSRCWWLCPLIAFTAKHHLITKQSRSSITADFILLFFISSTIVYHLVTKLPSTQSAKSQNMLQISLRYKQSSSFDKVTNWQRNRDQASSICSPFTSTLLISVKSWLK